MMGWKMGWKYGWKYGWKKDLGSSMGYPWDSTAGSGFESQEVKQARAGTRAHADHKPRVQDMRPATKPRLALETELPWLWAQRFGEK